MSEQFSRFAVLQLSGCAGCEVALLNAEEWIERYKLVYMPLVISAHNVPEVAVLLVSGGVRNDDDLFNLRRASARAQEVVAVGTCAIAGGVPSLGDRDEVRDLFMARDKPRDVPRLLPRCHPIDSFVDVDVYLPGCPPMPHLFVAALIKPPDFKASKIVCQECGRQKRRDVRPQHLVGYEQGEVQPNLCLINQGYFCVGSSTRGGCRAPCPRAGFPCVGCRGPSDVFIDRESAEWLESIKRVFSTLTDIPSEELEEVARSQQMALFLFQFLDYTDPKRAARRKEGVM